MPEPVEPARALDAIRNAFDGRATTYDEDVMHRAVAAEVASFAALEDVTAALDVATGTGLVLRALHDRAPRLRLIGADISAPTAERPYVRDHIPFRTLESFTATFADLGFAPGRHQTWSNDVDKVLIAELSELPAG